MPSSVAVALPLWLQLFSQGISDSLATHTSCSFLSASGDELRPATVASGNSGSGCATDAVSSGLAVFRLLQGGSAAPSATHSCGCCGSGISSGLSVGALLGSVLQATPVMPPVGASTATGQGCCGSNGGANHGAARNNSASGIDVDSCGISKSCELPGRKGSIGKTPSEPNCAGEPVKPGNCGSVPMGCSSPEAANAGSGGSGGSGGNAPVWDSCCAQAPRSWGGTGVVVLVSSVDLIGSGSCAGMSVNGGSSETATAG